MNTPDLSDKAPLDGYLAAVKEQVLAAIAAFEGAHPDWEVGACSLTLRCALRPELAADGRTVRAVWADMDVSRSQLVSEIEIPFRRGES